MDINDFRGLTKFKIIAPTFYILSWLMMLFGPVYFDVLYQRICIFILIYADLKILTLLIIMIIITYKSYFVLKRAKQESMLQESSQRQHMDPSLQINYGFIIPNYKEELEMMAETLDVLAAHKRAKERYLIFLAMEAHEEGSDQKAMELIANYKHKFRVIDYTQHKIRQFEQKGKASNVSWCAQHLGPILERNFIDPESLFLTIIDADSWAPDIYFDLMEEHIIKHYDKRHLFIYQPPQIFTRNNTDVPVTTRVYDLMHGFAHCANLYSLFDLTFPLSNYSLSYELVRRIGYWDTCADAIGEDFHTTQKAYWKTNGEVITVPIYAPFNQVNISTGKGYCEDVKARFWQAERHAQGCADLAYEFKMLFTHKFKLMNFVVFFQIFETFVLPGVLPWVFISLIFQSKILYMDGEPPELIPQASLSIIFNFMTVASGTGYILYEIFKRRSTTIIYKKENQSIFRMLEYAIFFTVNLFGISVPTFTIAAFSTLFGKREYIVAEKKGTTDNNRKEIKNI